MASQAQILKEKIITECHSWSVKHMNDMLDMLISQSIKERDEEMFEKIKAKFWDGGKNSGLRTLSWDGYSKRASVKDILDTISKKENKGE